MLLFISQAMKADQACIVIFREKTAFRRYMICLFHVLDRLGSLSSRGERSILKVKGHWLNMLNFQPYLQPRMSNCNVIWLEEYTNK